MKPEAQVEAEGRSFVTCVLTRTRWSDDGAAASAAQSIAIAAAESLALVRGPHREALQVAGGPARPVSA